jgi:hypothetical protein
MARRNKTKPVVEKVMHEVTPERYIDTGKVKIGQYYQRPVPQPDEDSCTNTGCAVEQRR